MATNTPSLWITFDFELGWGVVENQRWMVREKSGVYDQLHILFDELLECLECLEVPVCWATVGAMAQNHTQHNFDFLPSKIKCKLKQFCKDSKESTRDGRRLIDSLLASHHQKLVSHSYSHVVYTEETVTADHVRIDLAKVCDILAAFGGDPSVMVLPENKIPDVGLLTAAGVNSIRLPPKHSNACISRVCEKLYIHPSADTYANGLTTFFPGSMLFKPRGTDFASRRLFDLEIAGLKRQLNRGISQHIWLHPFNFGEYNFLFDEFKKFICWAVNRREMRHLDIECMGG